MTYQEQQAYYAAVWEAGGRTVIEPRPLRAVKLCRIICPSCGTVFYGEEADPKTHRHRCQDHQQRGGITMLTPEARAARAEAQREWRRRNPDKYRAQQEAYWQRRAEKAKAARAAAQAEKEEKERS